MSSCLCGYLLRMDEVAAILLAAGHSSRMGAFKPLLPFGNKSVTEHCITNLRDAGIEEIVVVLGHRGDEVREQLKHYDVSFALNTDPESEMNVSIARGVEMVSPNAKAVLIALADHPGVPSQIIQQVVDEWRRTGASLIQPEHEGRGGHPVLIDLAHRGELLNLDPQRGLRSLFDRHREQVLRLAVDSAFVARDMDTWEDYLRLHQDCFGRLPAESDSPF